MKKQFNSLTAYVLYASAVLFCICGCADKEKVSDVKPLEFDTDNTVASLANFYEFQAIPIRGFGIVAGLNGTGSSECPPALMKQMEKYIWKQIPEINNINARAFIENENTAVVEVTGVIPSISQKFQPFDVRIRPLSSTQTTSLKGGHLYLTELKERDRFTRYNSYANTLATAKGPIFYVEQTDSAANQDWYVLGGGKTYKPTRVSLVLSNPDFMAAGLIRNLINERFGPNTANAISKMQIDLTIPNKYLSDRVRFLRMVQALYLSNNSSLKTKRIKSLIDSLVNQQDKLAHEIALEAIGKPALDQLVKFLSSPDPAIRFHVARCMLYIGDDRAVNSLRKMVMDIQSPYRLQALNALGFRAKPNKAKPILLYALSSPDFQLRLEAYRHLLNMGGDLITRKVVGGDFIVDSVFSTGPKVIYISRESKPKFVIFGAPIKCGDELFIQANDGEITINARAGEDFAMLSRKHPRRPRIIGPVKASRDVSDIIRTLGEAPTTDKGTTLRPGLSVPYTEIIKIVKALCDQGAIDAVYVESPLPELN